MMKIPAVGTLLMAALAAALCAEPARAVAPGDGCVVVSGATGFVAGHVVEILLEKGYTVHGTVRSLKDESKHEFLRDIAAETPGTLELYEADLLANDAFDKAAEGCSSMIHIASVVMTKGMEPEAVREAALQGTFSALRAAEKNKFKALVVTSSVATIFPNEDRLEKLGKNYGPSSEADWNTLARPGFGTYAYSKVEAEKATLEWLEKHNHPFRYASVHFPYGIGPQQNARVTSSNNLVKTIISGEVPVAVPFRCNVIDIRDVARAHVHILEHDEAKGRYIVALDPAESSLNPQDFMVILGKDFPEAPIPFFKIEIPVWAAEILAKIDGRFDSYSLALTKYFDKHPGYFGTRLSDELGFEYKHKNASQTVIDAAQSMLDFGIADFENPDVNPIIVGLMSAPLLGAILLGIMWTLCCSSTKSAARPKKD